MKESYENKDILYSCLNLFSILKNEKEWYKELCWSLEPILSFIQLSFLIFTVVRNRFFATSIFVYV